VELGQEQEGMGSLDGTPLDEVKAPRGPLLFCGVCRWFWSVTRRLTKPNSVSPRPAQPLLRVIGFSAPSFVVTVSTLS
jgi:hypothetical protein